MKKYKVGHLLDIVGASKEDTTKFIEVESENEIGAMKQSYLLSIIEKRRKDIGEFLDHNSEGMNRDEVRDLLVSWRHCIVSVEEM